MKRFYEKVAVKSSADGLKIDLDGRSLKTPAGKELAIDSSLLAEAIAEEWRAQEEEIVPESMPLTKLAFTAVDRVLPNREAVVEQIAGYVNSDVVCYRAAEPSDLVERQKKVMTWSIKEH